MMPTYWYPNYIVIWSLKKKSVTLHSTCLNDNVFYSVVIYYLLINLHIIFIAFNHSEDPTILTFLFSL